MKHVRAFQRAGGRTDGSGRGPCRSRSQHLACGHSFLHARPREAEHEFQLYAGVLGEQAGLFAGPGTAISCRRAACSRSTGAFSDSAPDRWGRQLVEKQEIAKAREDGRRAEALDDVDYLLAVSDSTRHGAIRFAAGGGTFTNSGTDVPKLIRLPELLRASDDVAANDELSAIKRLLDAGTGSLGGARPKASIRFDDGRLGIAKFPHPDDNGESPWGRPGERGGRSDLREPEHFDTHCFAGLADDDLPRGRGGRTSLRESGEITRGAIRRLCRILSQRDFARANATYKDARDRAPPCRTGCRDQRSDGPHRGA